MNRKHTVLAAGTLGALSVGLMIVAGCGGGGPASSNAAATVVTAFKAILPAAQKNAIRVGAAKCAACHAAICTSQASTAHSKALVDCEACHGPGSVHVANPVSSNILHGVNATSAAVCGQCHTQEYNDWAGSLHAQSVADPVDSGSTTCERCHNGQFNPLNITEPIGSEPIPTTPVVSTVQLSTDPLSYPVSRPLTAAQVNSAILALSSSILTQYETETDAVLGRTTTAACTNCHDPHANSTNTVSSPPSNTPAQIYLRRATSNTDLSVFVPPTGNSLDTTANYTTVNHVCGNCHNNLGGNFTDPGLENSFSRAPTHESPQYLMLNGYGGAEGTSAPSIRTSSHVNIPDQCVHCHMGPNPVGSHTFAATTNNCAPCHTVSEAASNIANIQSQVQQSMGQLLILLQQWAAAPVDKNGTSITVPAAATAAADTSIWDYTSNWSTATANEFGGSSSATATAFEKSIPLQVLRARCNYYFLLVDRSYGVHNFKYTQWLLQYSIAQMQTIPGFTPKSVSLTKAQVQSMLKVSQATAAAGTRSFAADPGQ
jgi:hypothetical protein